MEPSVRSSSNSLTDRVARLQSEIDRLKAAMTWQKSVKRGIVGSKKTSLSLREVMQALYDTRYTKATLSS